MKYKRHLRKTERSLVFVNREISQKFKDSPCETDISRLICGFLQEEDEKQQISIIKQITAAAKTADAQTGEVSLCIQVLVNAYLHMAARIPKKRALVSCLQCFGSIFKEEIKDTLKEQICSMLLGVGNNPALKQIRDLVDMLHSLSENFPIGELCVSEIYVEALEFLARALKQFHQDTEINKSPVERKERMHDIMTAVQSVTKIGQKCLKPISLELFEGRKASLLSSIKQICESVTDILADDTFLLDCRVTCGIAVSLIVKICCDTEAVAMVINLISPNVKSDKLIENQSGALLKGGTEWLVARFSDALNRDTLPLVSYACLCHGVLAVLTEDELLTLLGDEKCLLVDVLFAELETFCNRMSDATTKLIVSRTLVLWTTRACSILASLPANMQLQFQGNHHVSDTLLQYVWTHWENPIDAVKHQSKVIFENCIKLHLLATKEDPRQSTFLVTLAEKLIHSNKHLKGKYASLSCLVEYVGTKALIKVEPNLCQDLLEVLSEQAMASHASELLEKLFIDHQMELDCAINVQEVKHLWLTTWVDPVLEGLCTGCKQLKTQLIEYVLPKLLRAEPYCVQYVITTITKQKHQGDNSSQLGALMTCLKRAKSIGILKTSPEEQEKWNEVVPVFVLRAALCHSDDQVRLDALGLLCENPKTTETINSTDFELVKFFLPLNMNSQSPAFRQTMLAFLKRFLCRVKESGQVLYRTLKCKKMESSPATEILELYKVFLHWLLDHIFSCLHPGAAFSRRTTALGALTILTEILSDQHKDFFNPLAFVNGERVQTLLECLVDTFEDNKRSALKVLSSLSTEQMGMQNQEKAVEILTACLQLVYSTKPQDCTTAVYLMKLVLRQDGIYKTLLQFLETFTSIGSEQEKNDSTELDADKDGECPLEIDRTDQTSFISEEHDNESHFAKFVTEYERAFQLWLEILLVHLSRQIGTARRNLLHAAATGPLYPVLHCVRLLLDDMDLRSVALPEKWKKLLEQLLNLCFKVSDIVLPVVSHSSPEGNIPEDEDILSSGLTEGTTEDDKDDLGKKGIAVKLMPEYLVVCCWRCVKEASLLLGQLTQTAPIKREEDAAGGLLSFQQILSIGEYFKKQLLESIHRGAFELAYAGFIKMCHTLWRCTVRDLHQLPSSWLLDIMKDIQDESGTKLCATRRSAGVPFYVQAIVTTEPASTGGKCLIQALELLLKLALPSSEAEQERISQVHSLNILRALFRDSRLGEAVAPYVADGLQAGIAGFNSPYWAVRNASTLLFSAMMTRIFGVKRSKEDMSKKNCMTGRVFFHRYPSLFQFLLKGLDEGTKNISDQGQLHLHPGLYPILMVMGRLFPAMVEGNDPKLNLPAYIPFVISCAGSRVFKTRVMAGRALRPLVFKDQLGSVLAQLTGYLPKDQQQRHSQNLTHGILLQVEHLLKELSNLPSSIVQEALDVTVTGIMEAKWLIFRENRCPVTRAAYFHVAQAMLQSSQRAEVDKLHILVDHLAKVVFTELSSQHPSGYISPGSVEVNVAMANLSINCDEVWNKLKELLNIDDGTLLAFFLESPFYEVRLLVLQHLTLLMSTPVSKSSKLEESNRLFQKLISMATGLEHHQGCLAQVFLVLVHHPCAKQFPWKLSSGLWQSSRVQDLLIKVQKTSSRDEVRSAACRLIGVILPLLYNQLEQDQFEEDLLIDSLSIIKASCDSEQNVSVREACAMVLAQPEMTSILRDENRVLEHHVLHLWESVIILLQDEDMLVKDITARAVDHLNNFACEEESEKKNQCLQPSMAIDICMKTMVELHHQTHPVECFTLLATWLLSEEKVEMEECVFDKGEINTYQEEVAFAQLLAKHLQKLLHYMNRGSGMKSLHASPNMMRTNEELDEKSFIMQTEQNTCVDEQQIRNLNQSSVLTKESLPDWSSDEGESPASSMADDDFINTTKRSEVLSLENVFQVRNPDFRHMDSRYATANKIKGQATKQLLSEMCGIQSVSTAPPRETSGKPPITTGEALGHEQDNSMNKGDDKAEFETVLHQTRHCLIKYLQEKVESPVVYGHSMPFVQMQKYQSEVISLYKHLLAAHCLELEQDVCTRFCYNQMIGQLKSKFDHFGMNCLLAEALE